MSKLHKTIKNLVIPAIVIAIISTAILFLLYRSGVFEALEVKTVDMRFVIRGERKLKNEKVKSSAVVIGVDAQTIKEVGRWPWPRGVIAKLISGICGSPAEQVLDAFGEPAAAPAPEKKAPEGIGKKKVVGIDVLFDREERAYKEFMLDPNARMADPNEQDALAIKAVKSCPAVVYVSLMKFADAHENEQSANMGLGDAYESYNTPDGKVIYNVPIPKYMADNTTAGFANMQPSRFDERVRKAAMYNRLGDKYVFSFALANLAAFLDVPQSKIKVEPNLVTVGQYKIPTDDDGNIYINYRAKEYEEKKGGEDVLCAQKKDNVISASCILKSPEIFQAFQKENSIYLIGVTDPEIKDIFYTPLQAAESQYPNNSVVSGIELHKEIIDTILQGDYLYDAPVWMLVAFLLIAGLLVSALTLIRLWTGIVGMFLVGGVYFWHASVAFNNHGMIIPVVAVLFSLPMCFAISMLYRNLVVDKEKNAVKNIFRSYVAPHVLAELMDNPSNLMLGGNKSKVSVLFSDIRGFTSISERHDPPTLIKGLNHYLSAMTKVVLDNSGMIDKFIGDAVMAVWGAPVSRENDAINAVRTAVKMGILLDEINPKINEYIGETFAIGLGINTGDATLGNIGSEGKLDYTVIGDTVNLASRLEGLTKQYGVLIIISEFTYAEVADYFDCRKLDAVQVKGKKKPVGIYQVISEKGASPDTMKKMLEHYNPALEMYHNRKFAEAKALFIKAKEISPEDKTVNVYIERCDFFMETPPPEDWDGSFEWKTK